MRNIFLLNRIVGCFIQCCVRLNIKRGVPGFELLAMELKLAGVYVSRQLSFHGVKVNMPLVTPSRNFACAYRRATELVIPLVYCAYSSDMYNRLVFLFNFSGRFFAIICIT